MSSPDKRNCLGKTAKSKGWRKSQKSLGTEDRKTQECPDCV